MGETFSKGKVYAIAFDGSKNFRSWNQIVVCFLGFRYFHDDIKTC